MRPAMPLHALKQEGAEAPDAESAQLRRRALLVIYLSVGIDAIGLSMSIPVMPFFVQQLGGHATEAGAIQGLFNAMQIVSSLWMGVLSDYTSRRLVLLMSMAGSATFMLLSAFCSSVPQLFVVRGLLGLFSGSFPVGEAFIASIVPGADRPRYMAMLGACNGLVFMLAPPLGALLAATPIGLLAPFYAGSVASVAAFSYGFFKLPNAHDVERARQIEQMAGSDPSKAIVRLRWDMLRRHFISDSTNDAPASTDWLTVGLVCAGAGVLGAVQMAFVSTSPFYVQAMFGWDQSEVGGMMSLMGVSAIFAQLAMFARIVSLVGVFFTGAVGAVLLSLGLLVFIVPWDASGLSVSFALVGNVLGGWGFIIGQSSISPALAEVASPFIVGTVVGFGAMSASFGRIIGPVSWNALFEFVGHKAPFAVAALVMSAVGLPFFVCAAAANAKARARLAQGTPSSRFAWIVKQAAERNSAASAAILSPPSFEAADALISATAAVESAVGSAVGSAVEIARHRLSSKSEQWE